MTLLELKEGDTAVISRISGGKGVLSRMAGLGLHEGKTIRVVQAAPFRGCLLYTSDAADDLLCVDLGGRRIIKKKKNTHLKVIKRTV